MDIEVRADFRNRGFCLFVNGEAIGNVFTSYKLLAITRDWLLSEVEHMKMYPDQMDNRSPQWLEFLASMESGWLDREPHQIVGRDFASGVADEPKLEDVA
jgi:hypothetical protein